MNTFIGIISYLPDNEDVRESRIQTHLKQINSLNSIYPNLDIIQVSQNYTDQELNIIRNASNTGRNFISIDSGKLGACRARNILLDRLYNSTYDFMLMLDDDSSLYPHYSVTTLFNDLENYANKENLGLIRPLIPNIMPFKRINYENKYYIERSWILRSFTGIVPFGIFILSNLNKFHNTRIYFNEHINPGLGQGYDDYDFVLEVRESCIPCYICNQVIGRPFESETVAFSSEDNRRQNHIENIINTYKRHTKLNIDHSVINGKVRSNIAKLNTFDTIYVPRIIPYKFESNLIPKGVSVVNRKSLI